MQSRDKLVYTESEKQGARENNGEKMALGITERLWVKIQI